MLAAVVSQTEGGNAWRDRHHSTSGENQAARPSVRSMKRVCPTMSPL
ncbi:MAG: hypothetical protein QOJ99_1968, partial [Bryobacterales bacterium]|nr:hypothetical protein [Bryobacterales bacterium]